jgi:hypothetical protein
LTPPGPDYTEGKNNLTNRVTLITINFSVHYEKNKRDIFQHGEIIEVLGTQGTGPIISFQPTLFLSTEYI